MACGRGGDATVARYAWIGSEVCTKELLCQGGLVNEDVTEASQMAETDMPLRVRVHQA